MATNENLPETLDPKARANLDLILAVVSTWEQRQAAAGMTILFEAELLAWIRRDETAETGPGHPSYFLGQRSPMELCLMAQVATGVLVMMGEESTETDQFRLVQAAAVLIRAEMVARMDRATDPELEF